MKKQITKNTISLWACASILLLMPLLLGAQDIKFEHINRDNGLPINSVTCLDQDKDGFIWMGSMYGLVKFDGTNYTTYTYDYADSTSIPGYLVTQIKCADDGKIYLSLTNNGISILDPKTEKFQTFEPEFTDNLSGINVNAMELDRFGNFWIGTEKGLHYFDTKNLTFKQYKFNPERSSTDNKNNYQEYVSSITIDKENNLYILGYNGDLIYFNTDTKATQNISYTNNTHESLFLFSAGQLYIDNKENVWIGTESNGIFIYDPKGRKKTKHLLPSHIISSIKQINNETWIGTDGNGIYIFNENGKITSLENDPLDPFSLSSNTVYCINQTKDHTIWVGTYLTGANLYSAARHKFSTISVVGRKKHRLSNKTILCIEQFNDSILLLGTDGGGINTLNCITGEVNHINSKNNTLDKIVAKSIAKSNETSFYLGTYSKGLYHCTLNKNNTITATPILRENKDRFNHVWSLYIDSDTSVWIGYLHAGLSLYNPKKNTFKDIDRYSDHNVHCIKNVNNEIWTSSEQKGLFINDKQGELIRVHENDGNDPQSLASNFVLEIFIDSKDRIWLGTNTTGLSLITNTEKGKFKNINTVSSFPADMVTNIEEDADGLLWVSTNIGIVRFNPDNYNSELFDRKDGLQGKQFNLNSSFNYLNKTLYFGGVDGLNFFQPHQIKKNDIVPHTVITGLRISNRVIKVNQVEKKRIILDKPIAYKSKIELSYKEDDFTIEFSALHYESSSKNQYKYMLQGFDSDWITCNPGQQSARYTNLNKGDFVFKVKAANPDNLWNKTPTELKISITPPFHNTLWFYFILLLFLLISIKVYTQWRTYRLEIDKKKLKNLVDLKTAALQEKALVVIEQNEEIKSINNQLQEYNTTRDKIFSILAHDLRSPLGAIVTFSKLLETEPSQHSEDEKKKFIKIIGQTSLKMNSLITNLLHWVNSQIGKIEPQTKEIHLQSVFNEVEDFTKANAIQKDISITFNHNNAMVFADQEMLDIILRNLVTNSIKFTPTNGCIGVSAISDINKTTLLISDSGVGMTLAQIENINNRETLRSTKGTDNESGTGLGLFLCKDFTEKNNGSFHITSTPNIGTTVTIVLPANKQ